MKVVAPLCNDSELGQLPEQLTIFYNLSRLYQNLTTFRPMPFLELSICWEILSIIEVLV